MADVDEISSLSVEMDEMEQNLKDVDSDSSSSFDPDSMGSESDSEEIKESKIKELFDKIQSNPYQYDSHVELIMLLRKAGELEQLRLAREQMSKLFPLTAELWIDWITDEAVISSQKEEKEDLVKLFERAVKDYMSVNLWLEYAQSSIKNLQTAGGRAAVREIFERALTAVGLHVSDSAVIWDSYREFEVAILATLQAQNAVDDQINEQKQRILKLFKRQLSVPLFDMEKTFEEYKEWTENNVDTNVVREYQKALKKLEKIQPYEESLMSSDAPHLAEYLAYLDFEEKQGEPSRVQCLYERAIVDNCLVSSLWQRYINYLDLKLKIGEIALPVYERAIRNCPWTVDLWVKYIAAAERYNLPHEKIKEIVDSAFQSGLTTAEDYKALWLAFLNYLRRRVKWDEEHELELEQLRTVFQKASDHLFQYFGEECDAHCTVLKYWAKVEAKFCKNLTKAREVLNMIIHSGQKKFEASAWIEYANFERAYGDDKHYRKTLHKALTSVTDFPETIGDALLTFEREEGTLESLDNALEKYEIHLARVNEKRKRLAEKEEHDHHQSPNKSPGGKRDLKRKFGGDEKSILDSDGFKIPHNPHPSSKGSPQHHHQSWQPQNIKEEEPTRKKSKSEEGNQKRDNRVKGKWENLANDDNTPEDLSTKGDFNKKHGVSVAHDPAKDPVTVFVSNLDYKTEEDRLKEFFASVGHITQVRLVRNFKGNSKGYGYVEFDNQSSVEEALKLDRTKLDGRPIFISRCKDKKKTEVTSEPKLKFSTVLEKNKLFIRGLPFTTSENDLKELYTKFGALKDVRLVTYRNGHSKGLAYVDFEDEISAAKALETDNTKIGENVISVAISNPPQRRPKGGGGGGGIQFSNQGAPFAGSRNNSTPSSTGVGRGRAPTLMVPRALKKMAINDTNGAEKSSENGVEINKNAPVMSNNDFRKLLNK